MRLADGRSLLQSAWLRACALPGVAEIVTVTQRGLFLKTANEYREVAAAAPPLTNRYLLEPCGRNTAAAIAAATLEAAAVHGADTLLFVLPADQLIRDPVAFEASVARAARLARDGQVVALGILPDRPETGFAYIEHDGTRVLQYVEKPALELARVYVASGRFLWSSGMLCFTAASMLAELARHCPAVLAAARASLAQASRGGDDGERQVVLDGAAYALAPAVSIDDALLAVSTNMAVVGADIGWRDLGSWSAVAELVAPDADGNRVAGAAQLLDVQYCYIQSGERLVAALGVRNLIIVDTPDALLVADRDRVQDVKAIVAGLATHHQAGPGPGRSVQRPWGSCTLLEARVGHGVLRIEVRPGGGLDLDMHGYQSEQWCVVSGRATVASGASVWFVGAGETTTVGAGQRHRLDNTGLDDLVIIAVQRGDAPGRHRLDRFGAPVSPRTR